MRRALALTVLLALGACGLLAPGQRFVVFFTLFSAQLDTPAQASVAEAAAAAKQHPGSVVHVVGFGDPQNNAQAAVDLSQQRAQVVSDLLVADGVPAESITREARGGTSYIFWSGESRRVEITVGTP